MKLRWAGVLISACFASTDCLAQALAPRAYVITPAGSNAIILAYTFSDGGIVFDGTSPIRDASGQTHLPVLSYYRGFGLFGRSANFTASLPYAVGNFSGKLFGQGESVYRSGLTDSSYRFSVNVMGGPAMGMDEFRSWRQKTLVGASLTVVAPTGQYDPARIVNQGSNRWAFKTEIGLSRRWRKWVLDAYGGLWCFTANGHFFPGSVVQTQTPIGVVETHLSYDVKQRLWFSVDGNFWYGGATSWNGVGRADTTQRNSRVGATASVPLSQHQSLKFSYNNGAYIRFGGNYQNVSAGWLYFWSRKPK